MFMRQRLYVCAISETKMKGRSEGVFGEVLGTVSEVGWWSATINKYAAYEVCSGMRCHPGFCGLE